MSVAAEQHSLKFQMWAVSLLDERMYILREMYQSSIIINQGTCC